MRFMQTKAWSPYLAGVVIGLLQVPAFILVDTALGASSSYVAVAGHLAALFDASVPQMDYFGKYMTSANYFWQIALVVGIAIGAFLSAKTSGTVRGAYSPVWTRAVGIQSLRSRAAMGFIGGFVLLFGARIAQGCTSGHGISGMSQLAVASITAVVAMFVGGIIVAMIFRRV